MILVGIIVTNEYREKLNKEIEAARAEPSYAEDLTFLEHCQACRICWPEDQYFGQALQNNALCPDGKVLLEACLKAKSKVFKYEQN